MGDILGHWAAHGDVVEILAALVSGGLVVLGAAVLLATLGARALGAGTGTRTSSQLLPMLAEDVLDEELREIYQRSLWLDTMIAEHQPSLADPTGTALGRQVRRQIVGLQADRFAARHDEEEAGDKNGSTRAQERLAHINSILDQAIDLAEDADEPAADIAAGLASLSDQMA